MTSRTKIGTFRRVASTHVPTKWGSFRILGFERKISNGGPGLEAALAIRLGDVTRVAPLPPPSGSRPGNHPQHVYSSRPYLWAPICMATIHHNHSALLPSPG